VPPIPPDVSTDAQTQAIPRVPVAAVTHAGVAALQGDVEVEAAEPATEADAPAPDPEVTVSELDAEVAASGAGSEIGCEVSVERIYEAGIAKLEALNERWAAAMAEVRQAPASGEPGAAAA
jgi:hypothetical protein